MATPRPKAALPVNYQEQLALESAAIAKRIAAPSGDRIRYNASRAFITPDGNEGEVLEGVIVEFMSTNLFYDSQFDRDNPQAPACFAIGPEPTMLVPSDNSPAKQAESCAVCPNNQFGSATVGKGKACKNSRLLAFMPLMPGEDDVPIWIMSVPPASLKAFDSYVSMLASKHKTIPIGVVTEITLDKDNTYASPRFAVKRPLTAEEFEVYMPQRGAAQSRLATEPDVSGYTPPAPKSRGVPAPMVRRK